MIECPECQEEFSSQGLWGHLSMGHGLGGAELDSVYEQALNQRESSTREKVGGSSGQQSGAESGGQETQKKAYQLGEGPQPVGEDDTDGETLDIPESPDTSADSSGKQRREQREPSPTEANEVERAADRLRRAKERLRMAEEETGEIREEEVHKGGAVSEVVGRLFPALGRTETREEVQRTEAEREHLEKCREAVEQAEREYRKALKKRQAELEYGEGR